MRCLHLVHVKELVQRAGVQGRGGVQDLLAVAAQNLQKGQACLRKALHSISVQTLFAAATTCWAARHQMAATDTHHQHVGCCRPLLAASFCGACSGATSGGMDAIAEVRDSMVFRHADESTVFHLPEDMPQPPPK